MMPARIKGTLTASQKAGTAPVGRYLLVEPCNERGEPAGSVFVAFDTVGAGTGEVVIVARGSSARQTAETKDTPVDAVIVGIVDLIEKKRKVVFKR